MPEIRGAAWSAVCVVAIYFNPQAVGWDANCMQDASSAVLLPSPRQADAALLKQSSTLSCQSQKCVKVPEDAPTI